MSVSLIGKNGSSISTIANGTAVFTGDALTTPNGVGAVRVMGENDYGSLTGLASLRSPEVDLDYRQRVSTDWLLDEEVFNYTAQNTGKHTYSNTTMTNAWTAGQMTTNSGAITTITTGTQFSTYAAFQTNGTTTLSSDTEVAFSAQPQTNTFIEWGTGIPGTSTTAPSDGVFFRLTSAGLQGIVSSNGTEVSTGIFPLSGGTGTWLYTNAKRYQFICYHGGVEAAWWVNDGNGAVLLGSIAVPAGMGRLAMAAGVSYFFKHRITGGAAGGSIQALVNAYAVRQGGGNVSCAPSTVGNRIFGSYQGLSGGTMGGLATYVNSTNPTAAAPSNTALTANLPGGLGGQGLVTAAAAAATDGIWSEYGVPAGTVNVPGRRLVVRGIRLDAVNLGAAVATTATTVQFSLAFGHTAVSLVTAEAATTKAPRRLSIGFMTWAIGAAIGAQPQGGPIFMDLGDAPIFVNPGERIALVGKFVAGTATASQTIQFTYQPVYGWE